MDAAPLTLEYLGQNHDPSPSTLAPHVLATIGFGKSHDRDRADPGKLIVGLRQLSPIHFHEQWRTSTAPCHGWQGDVGFVASQDLIFAHLLTEESATNSLTETTFRAYLNLLSSLRDRGFPHLLRMWNFISAIHGADQGQYIERYQAFCIGRAKAFAYFGIGDSAFPAATAMGAAAPGLLVYAFAARQPGIPIENPRQVSAYHYPARYSPRPPAFARALRTKWSGGNGLFVSGTASVLGHRSAHAENLQSQLRETLANIDAVVGASTALEQQANHLSRHIKVYLRHPAEVPHVASILTNWADRGAKILYLQGEVCRRELELEIEDYSYTARKQR